MDAHVCVCTDGGLGSALHVVPQELSTLCLSLLIITIIIDQEEQKI